MSRLNGREQLAELDGLIYPGGESTTIGKLMRKYGFIDAIREFSAQGKPIFGTCAGLIVMAEAYRGPRGGSSGADGYYGGSQCLWQSAGKL